MDLPDIKERFISLATETFAAMRWGNHLTLGLLLTGMAAPVVAPALVMAGGLVLMAGWAANILYNESMYTTSAFRNGMQDILGTETSLFGSAIRQQKQRSTRVAVMCMKNAANATAITNYNRPPTGNPIRSSQMIFFWHQRLTDFLQIPCQVRIVGHLMRESFFRTLSDLKTKRTS